MNVANGLQIGWLKCDKWQLAKNMGSLGVVCVFIQVCSYSVAKEKRLSGICLDNCWNKLRLFPENCMRLKFYTCKNVSFLDLIRAGVAVQGPLVSNISNGNIDNGTMSTGTPVTFNMLLKYTQFFTSAKR